MTRVSQIITDKITYANKIISISPLNRSRLKTIMKIGYMKISVSQIKAVTKLVFT